MPMMCLAFFYLFTGVSALTTSEALGAPEVGVATVRPKTQTSMSELEPSVLLKTDVEETDVEEQDDELPSMSLVEDGGGAELDDLMHFEKTPLQDFYDVDASSEKTAGNSFDCADEVVLRLAIAESFYGKSYDDCVNATTLKAFKSGGSGHRLMKATGSGGSGLTRAQVDARIRARCITKQGHGAALGPRLIRMTFHDAADFNNSMLANGTEVPFDKTGVDSCLRTALLSVGLNQKSNDDNLTDIAKGDPNHNRGLRNAEIWVLQMAAASKLSQPDMQVLGAVVAMESWFQGPEIGIQYGRVKGDCQKIICMNEACWDASTPFFKQPVAEPVGSGMFCPMTNTLQPLRQVMGLSLEQLVALQGAHSVGGVIVCSGLGNVAAGPYCPTNCGIPPGRFFDNGNLDGTSFDDTPGKLDNRYYQLLMGEEFEDLPACSEANKYFPHLSKRGLRRAGNMSVGGSGGGSGRKNKNLAATCSAGLQYDPENVCSVESCVENCSKSQVCLDAQNSATFDKQSYYKAWGACLDCKKLCSGSHSKKLARQVFKQNLTDCRVGCVNTTACLTTAGFSPRGSLKACRANRTACMKQLPQRFDIMACMGKCAKGKAGTACKKQCRKDRRKAFALRRSAAKSCHSAMKSCFQARHNILVTFKTCRACPRNCRNIADDAASQVYNGSGLHAARWCKRLSPIKKCMNASIKMPINGGWGDCPKDMQVVVPNTGGGRLTIIQNLERWTRFRGLYKRIMVLPSDWSYLGANDTKSLFKRYGNNETDWLEMFKQAFTRVAELGWNKLDKCVPVSCTLTSDKLSCPVPSIGIGNFSNKRATLHFQKRRRDVGLSDFVRPEFLEFQAPQCNPPLPSTASSCRIVGGYGVKAKVSCSSYIGYCSTAAGVAAETMIANEWATSGGQTPTCNQNSSSMLDTDASLGTAASPSISSKRVRRHRTLRGSVPEDGAVFLQGDMDVMDEEDYEDDNETTEVGAFLGNEGEKVEL